jgi:hypothetical protein
MAAISGWFAYQMFVLDDVEKAVIRLAMDSAIGAYHVAATPMLALHSRAGLFGQWPQHSAPRSDLLRNQSARTEARLRGILEEAWDMLSAMADRVVELTRQA